MVKELLFNKYFLLSLIILFVFLEINRRIQEKKVKIEEDKLNSGQSKTNKEDDKKEEPKTA